MGGWLVGWLGGWVVGWVRGRVGCGHGWVGNGGEGWVGKSGGDQPPKSERPPKISGRPPKPERPPKIIGRPPKPERPPKKRGKFARKNGKIKQSCFLVVGPVYLWGIHEKQFLEHQIQ